VSFFEPPQPPPRRDAEPPRWAGPPAGELARVVPVERFLARTGDAAVYVASVTVYATGLTIDLGIRLREPEPDGRVRWFGPGARDDLSRDDLFRFGVEFADGRRGTNLVHPPFGRDPDGPVLLPTGGGGSNAATDIGFWLWPLPPPGPLALVCAWPAQRIEETRLELDAAPIVAFADSTRPVWP